MSSRIYVGPVGRRRPHLATLGLMMAAVLGFGAASVCAHSSASPEKPPAHEVGLYSESEVITPDNPEQGPLFAALNQWMRQSMASYDYDLSNLRDPFFRMPSHRCGGQMQTNDNKAEDHLPPILKYSINSFKLVAITVNRDGSVALASFEDAIGRSYVLRTGDRFGRRQGRIVKITGTTVTIEEPGRGPGDPPLITERKLQVPDTPAGVAKSGEQAQTQ